MNRFVKCLVVVLGGVFILALLLMAGAVIYYQTLVYRCGHEKIALPDTSMRQFCWSHGNIDPIGIYQVGDLTFHIPRKYVWENRFLEGPVESILMQMYYPSLQSVPDFKPYPNEIYVNIYRCKGKTCATDYPYTYQYGLYFIVPRLAMTSQPVYRSDLGMWEYMLERAGKPPRDYEMYYKDNQAAPQYWYRCDVLAPTVRPYCVGDYWFSKGVSVEIRFPLSLLKEHQNIHQAVDRKLHSFLVGDTHEPQQH